MAQELYRIAEAGPGGNGIVARGCLGEAVLASEIEQLADLSGFLKVASRPEWRRVASCLYPM